jgi:segregation and condensation protein B
MSRAEPQGDTIIEHTTPAIQPTAADSASELPAELADAVDDSDPSDDLTTEGSRLSEARLRSVLESLLLVADRPLPVARLVELLSEAAAPSPKQEGPPLYQAATVQAAMVALAAEYRAAGRGIELHPIAGGWQLRTAAANAAWVQRLLQTKPTRLARAQLETLAIVAYRQPITRPEIDDIRGVDSGGSLKTLLERRLIRILGKKEEPGRPLLYGTTKEFLEFFNLRDLKDLPTLREYYDLSEEHKAQVRAAHGEGSTSAPGEGSDRQNPELPLPAPGQPSAAPPPSSAEPPSPDTQTRVDILNQQLADDADYLAKIDAMIGAVSTDFPSLDAILSPGSPPPPNATPDEPTVATTEPSESEEQSA